MSLQNSWVSEEDWEFYFFSLIKILEISMSLLAFSFGFGWCIMLLRGLVKREFFFFNWWKIALQCYVGFCCTTQISHNYI